MAADDLKKTMAFYRAERDCRINTHSYLSRMLPMVKGMMEKMPVGKERDRLAFYVVELETKLEEGRALDLGKVDIERWA